MAIRINCPSCKVVNTIDEAKRGKKVRCRKCEKPISVPAADDEDEPEEERPAKKKKPAPAKNGSSLMLILGGVAAVLLFCLVGVGGLGSYLFWPQKMKSDPGQA